MVRSRTRVHVSGDDKAPESFDSGASLDQISQQMGSEILYMLPAMVTNSRSALQ